MSFWKELKRRNVYKVGVAYAIVAWLLIQATAIVSPALQLPNWMLPVVIVLLIIGFLIALLLAWAYEVTPEGIQRTKEVPLTESITHLTGKKLNYIVIGLLILAVGFLAFKDFYLDRRAVKQEVITTDTSKVPAVSEVQKAKKTIAVLPFENLSSDPEQVYFVDGLSEEILNSLCQIPDLGVAGRTSSFSFKDSNKTIQEIASLLGVENILEGSVRKAGNALRITAQLVRASDGLHLWSKTYDRELKDIFEVQEDIANAVANEMKSTLGIGKSFKQLGGTENEKAYEYYLVALGQASKSDYSGALESIDTALALDPGFALAWSLKARAYIVGSFIGQAQGISSVPLDLVKRAIEIEPNLGSAYINLGNIQSLSGYYVEAELSFRKAVELLKESLSGDDDFIVSHYQTVGKFKRAREFIEQIRRNDPLHIGYAGYLIVDLGFMGDIRRAEDEYEWCKAAFGDDWWFKLCITNARIGSGDALSRDEVVYSDLIYDMAKEYLDSPEMGLVELRRLFANNDLGTIAMDRISLWAAYFGDPDFALDAIEKNKVDSDLIGTGVNSQVWFPLYHEVRRLPRFKKYMKEVGLVDYWNKFGWPDICHQLDNSDFECD